MAEVGQTENPPGTNKVKYNKWFYGRDVYDGDKILPDGSKSSYPWCFTFVSWVCFFAGAPLGAIQFVRGIAGCPFGLKFYQKKGTVYLTINSATRITKEVLALIRPGDIFIVDWNGDGKPDHTGFIVRDIDGIRFETIEGNTGFTTSKDPKVIHQANSNGGAVANRTDRRYISGNTIWYFIRPQTHELLAEN